MRVCDVCRKGPDGVKQARVTLEVQGRPSTSTLLEIHDECCQSLYTKIGNAIGEAVGDWAKSVPVVRTKPEGGG